MLLVHRGGVPRRRRRQVGRKRLHRRHTSPIPTYKQVCGGDTGHAEAIRITFDPDQLSYDDLLDIFFATHDPTQLNRQGNDVGTQYRSAIFPQDEEQERKAREAIERANADNGGRVVTTIEPMGEWYPAEDYHQDYWAGEGQRNPYCIAVIPPKLQKLRKSFQARAKSASGDRLGGAPRAQAVVDRRAEALVGDRRDGDARLWPMRRPGEAGRTGAPRLRPGRPTD